MTEVKGADLTIRELAERTGMTVRNIRAYQTRGLIPPPVVRGRTGYYNEGHVARIELTRQMQADGLNLEAIRRVLDSGENTAAAIFDFTRALKVPFEDEAPEIIEIEELVSVAGGEPDVELQARAEQLGVFRSLPDGRVEIISPRLLRVVKELTEQGISPRAALVTGEKLKAHVEGAAQDFVELFTEEIWDPFEAAGLPEQDWEKVGEALRRTRPLAAGAIVAMFQIAMGEVIEEASERRIKGESKPKVRAADADGSE